MEVTQDKISWAQDMPNYSNTGIKSARIFANAQFIVSCIAVAIMLLFTLSYGAFAPIYIVWIISSLVCSYLLKIVLLMLATIAENQLIQKYKTLYKDVYAQHLFHQ